MDRNDRDVARRLAELSFVLDEVALYLDAHPDNPAALEYFNRMRDEYRTVLDEYESTVGPLTHMGVRGDGWTWNNAPWPWKRGE